MNKIYDNGALLVGNIDLVIKEIRKDIDEDLDMLAADREELLKDLEELKKINVEIVCVNYENGMGCMIDYWTKEDEVKEAK